MLRHPGARRLEELLRIEQRLGALRLDLDMMDRVGFAGSDRLRYESEAQDLSRDEASRGTERAALVARLRAESPDAIAEWVDAHVSALRARLAQFERESAAGENRTTHAFVAREAIDEWEAFRRAERDDVRPNVYYIAGYADDVLDAPSR